MSNQEGQEGTPTPNPADNTSNDNNLPNQEGQDISNDDKAFMDKLKSMFGKKEEPKEEPKPEPNDDLDDLSLEAIMSKLTSIEEKQKQQENLKNTNVDFATLEEVTKTWGAEFKSMKEAFAQREAELKAEFEQKLTAQKEELNKNTGRVSGQNPYLYNSNSDKIRQETPKTLKYN